jgi:hypothetical protein
MLIVRYEEYFRRMGSLKETFACSELELRALKVYKHYSHGEALGKHSDITGTFDDTTLTVLTDDTAFIDAAVGHGLVGGCPFAGQIADMIGEDGWSNYVDRFIAAGIDGDELATLIQIWHIDTNEEHLE